MKKIIGIVGSPRNEGNTAVLVQQMLKGAAEAGAATQIVYLNNLTYRGCQACYKCHEVGCCAQLDDLVPVLYDVAAADALVLGSPNYMGQMSGQMKLMLDRFCSFMNPDFTSRLAAGKKLALVFTQGMPNAQEYAGYYESTAKSLAYLGFTGSESLVAAGLRGQNDAAGNAELMAQASEIGKRLTV
ncbi:MAG: flavodoxin family protein [Armatimonadota bacterium]